MNHQDHLTEKPLEQSLIAGSFNLQTQMPNGRGLTMSGYVYQGESVEQINERLDVFTAVLERQRAIAELPEFQKKVRELEDAIKSAEDGYAKMEPTAKAGKLRSDQKAAYEAFPTNITHYKMRLHEALNDLVRAQKAAGG